MTKQLTILTIILTYVLSSYGQTKPVNQNLNKVTNAIRVDSTVIAILPYDSTQHWMFKNCKPANLTNADLLEIEKHLNNCIVEYNPEQARKYKEIKAKYPNDKIDKKHFVIDLTGYKRQYVAVTNEKGEKEVWVNCFCNTWDENWKKGLIFVKDGGNCYFNLKINLAVGKYYELLVNGDA